MDNLFDTKYYQRIFRWLGLCTDYYADSEDEDDQAIAARIRKNPAIVLDGLVQIRMALITFKMSNVTHSKEGNHNVKKSDLSRMIKEFPPTAKDEWWPVWLRFLEVMDDSEWLPMWTAVDYTIEELLTTKSDGNLTPSIFN